MRSCAYSVHRWFGAVILMMACLNVSHAQAASKTECMAAHEKSQELRRAGSLRKAREQLVVCMRDSCPNLVRKDCTQWLPALDESMPTVVIDAVGPDGHAATQVKVSVDGELLAEKLDGRAVPVDPGEHTFQFELSGATARQQVVVIREGGKNQKVSADFSLHKAPPVEPAHSAAPPAPAPTPTATATTEPTASRPVPALVYVLGGLGVATLGAGVFFELHGSSQHNDLDTRGCKPNCPQSEVDSAKRNLIIGQVLLGVSAVSLGTAVVLYFTRAKRQQTTATNLDLGVTPGGGMAVLRAAF